MKILIVEDNISLATPWQRYLKLKGYASDVVHGYADAMDFLWNHAYDIIALDLNLPDGAGEDILHHLRHQNDSTPVIITTARTDYKHSIHMLNDGADCYLNKPFHFDEFIARCHAIIRRSQRPTQSQNSIQFGNIHMHINDHSVTIGKDTVILPHKEFQILLMLMEKRTLCSKQQLINRLYQVDESPSENAIETYISRLRKRIVPAGVGIQTVHGQGYILTHL